MIKHPSNTSQLTGTVLMIRPTHFAYNPETAISNAFQQKTISTIKVEELAIKEFDGMVTGLRNHGLEVLVMEPESDSPDAVFPNNWLSFHANNKCVLYPMLAPSRRRERNPEAIKEIEKRSGVDFSIVDFTKHETEHKYLEGTGSLVLDRRNRIAYACISPRTNRDLVETWCREMEYRAHCFHAADNAGMAIYHTNVMMSVGRGFAVVCEEIIADKKQRIALRNQLKTTHDVVTISLQQMNHFSGNNLQLQNAKKETFIVMSSQAKSALNAEQLATLEKYGKLLDFPLSTIETLGGGSARCMLAEIVI